MTELDLASILLNATATGAGLLGIAAVALLARPTRLPAYSLALMTLLAILVFDAASSIFDLSLGRAACRNGAGPAICSGRGFRCCFGSMSRS